MGPTLIQLRSFTAVYEENSFTAAAVREKVTQSGISQHVSQLEHMVGARLFNRERGVDPTPAGHAFYIGAIQVLRSYAKVCRTFESEEDGLYGSLHFGLVPTLTRSVLAPSLLAFQAEHPRVSVKVTEANDKVLAERVRGGGMDFAIVHQGETSMKGLTSTLFALTPAFLMSSSRGSLTHCAPIRLGDMSSLKLVYALSATGKGSKLSRYLNEQNVQLDPTIEFDTVLGMMDLVRSSNWTSIVPGIFGAEDIIKRNFALSPLVNPPFMYELMLIEPARQTISAAGHAFVEIIRAATEKANVIPTRVAQGEKLETILGQSSSSQVADSLGDMDS